MRLNIFLTLILHICSLLWSPVFLLNICTWQEYKNLLYLNKIQFSVSVVTPGASSLFHPPFFPFQSIFLSGKISCFPAVRMNNLLRSFAFLNFRLKNTIDRSWHSYNSSFVINELYFFTISDVWGHEHNLTGSELFRRRVLSVSDHNVKQWFLFENTLTIYGKMNNFVWIPFK